MNPDRHILRRRSLIPLLLLLLLGALVVGTWYRYQVWQDKESRHLAGNLAVLEIGYRAVVNMFGLATETYFAEIINRPEVLALLAAGLHGEGQERDLARGRLYRLLYPSYDRLRVRNLRHLHFHLPDCISFLRFHRPEHYGDDLTTIQPTIALANARREAIRGFEVGKSASAFRYLYPLARDGEHLGTVDLSVPFKALREELTRLEPQREFTYILDRAVAEKALADQLPLYSEAPIHPAFLVEDSGYQLPDSPPPPSTQVAAINEKLRHDVAFQARLQEGGSFATTVPHQGQRWAVALLRMHDVRQQPVGYLLAYAPDSFLAALYQEYLISLLIAWTLLIAVGLLWVLLARSWDRLHLLATSDPLTGLANRRFFLARLSEELGRFRRFPKPTALLMLDLDFFKKINDTYGHGVGDEVLKQFAALTRRTVREIDLVGRLGGEEFAVLLPGADVEGATAYAERLRCSVATRLREQCDGHLFATAAGELKVTVSIGITLFSADDHPESVLNRADQALYQAKENGRNRIELIL